MDEIKQENTEGNPEETAKEIPQGIMTTELIRKVLKEKKQRGIGFTRKSKSPTKKAAKLARKQRKTNQQRKNQKRRPTGSKQRK